MTAVATAPTYETQTGETQSATAQWRRRVFRISSLCEIGFGTLWLANGVHGYAPEAAPIVLVLGVMAFIASIRSTRGTAPRPSGARAKVLERRITIATVAQIGVSVGAPVALTGTGHGNLGLPVVIASVGALFVWLHREVDLPRLNGLGAALVVIPVASWASLSGSAQATSMLVSAGLLMIATGTAGARALQRSTTQRSKRASS